MRLLDNWPKQLGVMVIAVVVMLCSRLSCDISSLLTQLVQSLGGTKRLLRKR